jgi:hypothetical protein
LLLAQATADRDSLHQQIEGVLSSVAALLQSGKHNEAIEILQSQPQGVLRAPRVQLVLTALQEERQQVLYRMTGRAYAGLEVDLRMSESAFKRAAAAAPGSTVFSSIAESFFTRGRNIADQILSDAMRKSKEMVHSRDKDTLERVLQSATGSVAYASPAVQAEWQRMEKKLPKGTGSTKRPR